MKTQTSYSGAQTENMETLRSEGREPASLPNKVVKLPPTIRSADLFRGGNRVIIEHDGQFYYLVVTRNNKLLLQK